MTADVAGELTRLAAWIDGQLDSETADRQTVAETAADRLRDLAASLPAPALTDAQREVLRQALGDAIAWHTDPEPCGSCEYVAPALCAEHAEAVRARDAYIKLSRELGIEVRS